jgi:hypothetical protein
MLAVAAKNNKKDSGIVSYERLKIFEIKIR